MELWTTLGPAEVYNHTLVVRFSNKQLEFTIDELTDRVTQVPTAPGWLWAIDLPREKLQAFLENNLSDKVGFQIDFSRPF